MSANRFLEKNTFWTLIWLESREAGGDNETESTSKFPQC